MAALKRKEKGEYFNCGKKGHFVREYRLAKQARAVQPSKTREPRKKANAAEYGKTSWTAYYEDNCLVYLSEKDGADYFLKGRNLREERV
jgi:hypothetical protein